MEPPALWASWTAPQNLIAAPVLTARGALVVGRDRTVRLIDHQGEERWQAPLDRGSSSTPALWGPLGIAADESGALQALVLATGELRWKTELGVPIAAEIAVFGRYTVVALGAARPGGADGGIATLDAATGKLLWREDKAMGSRARPCLSGDEVVLGFQDGSVRSLDLKRGWECWAEEVGSAVLGGAAVFDRVVLVPLSSGEVVALDLVDGSSQWRVRTDGPLQRAHVVKDGDQALLGGSDGVLRALDPQTGDVRWQLHRGAKDPAVWSSPARVGDLVVAAADLGDHCVLVGVDADAGTCRWELEIPGSTPSAVAARDGWLALTMAHTKQLHLLTLSDSPAPA